MWDVIIHPRPNFVNQASSDAERMGRVLNLDQYFALTMFNMALKATTDAYDLFREARANGAASSSGRGYVEAERLEKSMTQPLQEAYTVITEFAVDWCGESESRS